MVIPSSHRMFLACKAASTESDARRERGAPDEESLRKMAEEAGIEPLAGPAGSVIFFECNLMHGWSSNITPWPRSSLFTAFNSVDNALVDPYGGDEPRPQFLANRRDTSPLPVA
jgi:ectoine hydroxylase